MNLYRDSRVPDTQIAAQDASSTAQAALQRVEGTVRDVNRIHATILDLRIRIEVLEAEIAQLKAHPSR